MKYAGLDYSTHAVDVVLLDETGGVDWHRYPLQGHDRFERTRFVRQALPGPTAELWDDVLGIGIEEPMAGNPKMRKTISDLKCVQGAILACLPPRTLVQPYNAKEWRTAVGLSGNATKGDVQEFFVNTMLAAGAPGDMAMWPQDACDAYCIARAVASQATVVGALL